MTKRYSGVLGIPLLFWVLACLAMPLWIHFDPAAWDLDIYRVALHSLRAGHDPYADGIAVQKLFHSQLALHPNDAPPYTYVYSPMTLPLLRAAGALPGWLSGGVYWLLYAAGVLVQIWVFMQAAKPKEWRYFLFIAPAAIFFPGLLIQDVILSGNIIYILYGLIFFAAWWGWQRNQWSWFYLAVLIASCFKAPLLSLLPLAIFSARKQWLPAIATGIAGLALFAMQPLLWPSLFHNYLEAVELQFSYNHDFGLSPAGILGRALAGHGISYSPATTIFYLLYVIPVFGVLLYLSRQFLEGRLTLAQWMPVLLIGAILLNPRIMTYDAAPLAIPMALIVWRFFAAFTTTARTILYFLLLIVGMNAVILIDTNVDFWKTMDGILIVAVFIVGCWDLFHLRARSGDPSIA